MGANPSHQLIEELVLPVVLFHEREPLGVLEGGLHAPAAEAFGDREPQLRFCPCGGAG